VSLSRVVQGIACFDPKRKTPIVFTFYQLHNDAQQAAEVTKALGWPHLSQVLLAAQWMAAWELLATSHGSKQKLLAQLRHLEDMGATIDYHPDWPGMPRDAGPRPETNIYPTFEEALAAFDIHPTPEELIRWTKPRSQPSDPPKGSPSSSSAP
jgi:hypothetical protein